MPTFDFVCKDCGLQFIIMISNADKHKAKCPDCGSANIKQLISLFNTTRAGSKTNNRDDCQTCNNIG